MFGWIYMVTILWLRIPAIVSGTSCHVARIPALGAVKKECGEKGGTVSCELRAALLMQLVL